MRALFSFWFLWTEGRRAEKRKSTLKCIKRKGIGQKQPRMDSPEAKEIIWIENPGELHDCAMPGKAKETLMYICSSVKSKF